MPLTHELIEKVLARYVQEWEYHERVAQRVATVCQELLQANLIRGGVQFRGKQPGQLRRKLLRMAQIPEKAQAFDSVEQVFGYLGDLAGVRITTYVEAQRREVVTILQDHFTRSGDRSVEVELKDRSEDDRFYRATHCQVSLGREDVPRDEEDLLAASCEIQVCSMLAHVWNEIEHDLAYKPLNGDLSAGEHDLLVSLGQMLTAGDTLINLLLEANRKRLEKLKGRFVDEFDFVARTRVSFPDVERFFLFSAELLALLRSLGLDNPQVVREELLGEDGASRARGLAERFQSYLREQRPGPFRIDPESSDVLLVLLLERRGREILESWQASPGVPRGVRVEALAQAWVAMEEAAAD